MDADRSPRTRRSSASISSLAVSADQRSSRVSLCVDRSVHDLSYGSLVASYCLARTGEGCSSDSNDRLWTDALSSFQSRRGSPYRDRRPARRELCSAPRRAVTLAPEFVAISSCMLLLLFVLYVSFITIRLSFFVTFGYFRWIAYRRETVPRLSTKFIVFQRDCMAWKIKDFQTN